MWSCSTYICFPNEEICASFFFQLSCRVINPQIFGLWQSLMARNVRKLFLLNCGSSHFYKACAASMTWVEGPFQAPKVICVASKQSMIIASKKLCFVSVVVFAVNFFNHSSHRGNTAQGLAQWQHPVASSEAQDVLHQAMHPASYWRIRMVVKIASKVGVFFSLSILSLSAT